MRFCSIIRMVLLLPLAASNPLRRALSGLIVLRVLALLLLIGCLDPAAASEPVTKGIVTAEDSLERLLKPPASCAPWQKQLLFVGIGVGRYSEASGIPALQFVDDDLRALDLWVSGLREYCVYRMVLLDELGYRSNVIRLKNWLGSKIARGELAPDVVMLYLSGHGMVSPTNGDFYFLTHDAVAGNFDGTALRLREILVPISGWSQSYFLFLLDACQAGATFMDTQVANKQTTAPPPRPVAVASKGIDANNTGIVEAHSNTDGGALKTFASILAASRADQTIENAAFRLPKEDPAIEGHGLTTYAWLKVASDVQSDVNRDWQLTISEIFDRLGSAMVSGQRLAGEVSSETSEAPPPVMRFDGPQKPLFRIARDEVCNGSDDDLDGQVDEGFRDQDGDGKPDCSVELCNGIDDDGDGFKDEDFDADGDGFPGSDVCPREILRLCREELGGTISSTTLDLCLSEKKQVLQLDCNDADRLIHPGQRDLGEGDLAIPVDNNCNGLFDDDESREKGQKELPDNLEQSYRQHYHKPFVVKVALASTLTLMAGTFAASNAIFTDPYSTILPVIRTYAGVGLAAGAGVTVRLAIPILKSQREFKTLYLEPYFDLAKEPRE